MGNGYVNKRSTVTVIIINNDLPDVSAKYLPKKKNEINVWSLYIYNTYICWYTNWMWQCLNMIFFCFDALCRAVSFCLSYNILSEMCLRGASVLFVVVRSLILLLNLRHRDTSSRTTWTFFVKKKHIGIKCKLWYGLMCFFVACISY